MSSNTESLKKETTVTNNALQKVAEKTGEIKERISQATEDAQVKVGEVANRAAQKSNEIKARLDDKAEDVKSQVSEQKRDLRDSFETGKAQVRAEREASTGDVSTLDPNIDGLSLVEKAQLAADEVYRAAGETPAPNDAEGGMLETAANVVSNTVDLAKQAVAKTAETASSVASHVSQAFEGVPRRVDLSEIENKEAQEKVNDLKAEHQELLDQADKKETQLAAELHVNKVQGREVTVPQTVSLAEVSGQTAAGIIGSIGQTVSDAFGAVKDKVRGTEEEIKKVANDVDRVDADQTRAT